ncbi:MAG: sigma-70 family RNA polymerase sigma factor [Ruminococcus sp.]|nr:sigma-70 family RNA polymerase sigma factor [Ruminococcus sp.]
MPDKLDSAVYNEYAEQVYKYLFSLCHNSDTAEELTQETFYRAVKSIKNYDGSCKLYVWLCQIAKHVWYKELESRKKSAQPLEEALYDANEDPESSQVLRSEKMELFKAMQGLEQIQREVVYLRLTGEFSFREIGEILHKDETWARVTFYRAKQKLKSGMSSKDNT